MRNCVAVLVLSLPSFGIDLANFCLHTRLKWVLGKVLHLSLIFRWLILRSAPFHSTFGIGSCTWAESRLSEPFLARESAFSLDGLIKPIVLYGTPIYTPNMSIIKHISKQVDHNVDPDTKIKSQTSILKKISLLNSEKVHLHFLKWWLGVHHKASPPCVSPHQLTRLATARRDAWWGA